MIKKGIFSVVALSLGLVMSSGVVMAAEGDAGAGEKVFRKCKACHDTGTKHKVGPALGGIFGRNAGTIEGYGKYSDALKESGLVWDEATLDKFLTKPKEVVPGTKMAFVGLKKEKDRNNIIAYLKTLK